MSTILPTIKNEILEADELSLMKMEDDLANLLQLTRKRLRRATESRLMILNSLTDHGDLLPCRFCNTYTDNITAGGDPACPSCFEYQKGACEQ